MSAGAAHETGLPSIETEEWRYSSIGDLTLDDLEPSLAEPVIAADAIDRYTDVVDERSATVIIVDGWVTEIEIAAGWAEKGLQIVASTGLAVSDPSPVEGRAADPTLAGHAAETTIFDHLHRAFSPPGVLVRVPTGLTVRAPIVVLNHQSAPGLASFPRIAVEAGDGSDVMVLERQTSTPGRGLSVPIIELRAGPAARLRYQTIQELDPEHWQLARMVSSADQQATLTAGLAAFGGRYARLRVDSRLVGRGATANLVAGYYGDGSQVHDFRVFQHHEARDTRSDLLFKGAQDDSSGSIYTGLIHIHPDGSGANAFQTNRNIKLSPDAWAWSVPNLEIENNDVHCSHASTVSPVDEDQQFYLQSRGVPPVIGDRLIVAGFFDEVIGRLPIEATRAEIRHLVSRKLDRRIERIAA